jgi:hypothetical protein
MRLLETRVAPNPAVLATALRHELVLLSMATSHYYTLNESGARIWQDLQAGCSLLEISQRLEAHYQVSPAQAQRSVMTLVRALAEEQLVLAAIDAGEAAH